MPAKRLEVLFLTRAVFSSIMSLFRRECYDKRVDMNRLISVCVVRPCQKYQRKAFQDRYNLILGSGGDCVYFIFYFEDIEKNIDQPP